MSQDIAKITFTGIVTSEPRESTDDRDNPVLSFDAETSKTQIYCEVKYQSRVDKVKGLAKGDRFVASGNLMSDEEGLLISVDDLVNQTGRSSQGGGRRSSGGSRQGRSGRFRN